MGAGGSVGFVGRVFGGMAARNGATLTAESVSSVATRPANAAGTIAGGIADRSLGGYMPHLAGALGTGTIPPGPDVPSGSMAGMQFSGTEITGGHIRTTATGPDGKQAQVELFNAGQYERPESPHTMVNAADGSQWYQTATGDAMSAFYPTPGFTGDSSEAAQVAEAFPNAPEGTLLRQVDEGSMEASYPDGSNGLWYNSAFYEEPDAPHETIQGADGLSWYAMTPHASMPQFEGGGRPSAPGAPGSGGEAGTADGYGEAPSAYDRALFGQFMPGYEQSVVSIDSSRAADGVLEVRHGDGSGTAFYDRTLYQPPRGDYHVFEDSRGSQWYAIPGTPAVERRPVYEDGKPVYDGDSLRTVNVEAVRYKTTPTPYGKPAQRPKGERKPPRKKT